MMTLTETDRAFLNTAEDRYCYRGEEIGPIGLADIYRAGVLAGLERAAGACARDGGDNSEYFAGVCRALATP